MAENIFLRRSIRSYTGEMPSDDELALILKAVYASPVGMGRYDSLHVTVVKNGGYLARLEAAAGAQLGKADYHPLYGAPVLLIFSSIFPGIPTDNSSYSNCAILSQNAALEAVSSAADDLTHNVSPQLTLEVMLLRIKEALACPPSFR